MKRYDLMHQVNTRGSFLCSQKCIPHLSKAANPHILNLSPPLNMEERWFAPHVAYTMAKFGMSLCVRRIPRQGRGGQCTVAAHRHRYRRRSDEPTSELQSLMRITYAVFCLKKKNDRTIPNVLPRLNST